MLDNFSTGRRENLAAIADDVEFVEGDIRSYERVHTAVRGCQVVLHQAALPSVPRSVQDPLTSTDVNVTGTLNVLLNARDAGVERVVLASSSSIYGANPALPKREELAPAPMCPYAVVQAGRRGIWPLVLARLRARVRRAALLQRLRPAPGSRCRSTRP